MTKSFQVPTAALTCCFIVVLLCAPLCATSFAQPQGKTNAENSDAQPVTAATAKALYEEADGYVRLKFNEFARTGVPYDQKLEQKIYQEQRELASRNVARLSAHGGMLHGLDLYYAGLLYTLADKTEFALDALRRFLAEDGGAPQEVRQQARVRIVQQATASGLMLEAEKFLAEYMRAEPRAPNDVNKLQLALASSYYKKKEYERAAAHARVSFELALRGAGDKSSELHVRDSKVYTAGEFLANALLKANRRPEAIAVIQRMRALAFALPSARLYGSATELLLANNEPLGAPATLTNGNGTAAATALPPDIRVTEWIEQSPFKLADMRGRVVLLDFWATWCGPCRASMPKLNALYKKYQDRGFVVVGLTNYFGNAEGRDLTPADEAEYLRQFRKKNGIAYGFGVADHTENEMNYGIQAIPTAFLIDRRGNVRFITTDASDAEAKALAEMVRQLIEEK